MKKFIQNKVAESRLALPVTIAYASGVWLLSGLIQGQWWLQGVLYALAVFLMFELNNINALIRIYSRMVSCAFLALLCMPCFLFSSISGAVMMVAVVASMMLLFTTYQDEEAAKASYYSFVFVSIASMAFVHILFYLPMLWLMMAYQLKSFSLRTFGASILGLLTPYWFYLCWLVWQKDFTPLVSHFMALGSFAKPFDFSLLTVSQLVTLAAVVLLAIIGIIHYIRQHHDDKIRIRLLYGFFIWMNLLTMLFLALQPQHYDFLIRILVINTAPLLAHFVTLTHTKLTNIAFFVIVAIILVVTGFNLWM